MWVRTQSTNFTITPMLNHKQRKKGQVYNRRCPALNLANNHMHEAAARLREFARIPTQEVCTPELP